MMLLANTYFTVANLIALFVVGLILFLIGYLAGNLIWSGQRKRIARIDAENARLVREAAALEQECRALENA